MAEFCSDGTHTLGLCSTFCKGSSVIFVFKGYHVFLTELYKWSQSAFREIHHLNITAYMDSKFHMWMGKNETENVLECTKTQDKKEKSNFDQAISRTFIPTIRSFGGLFVWSFLAFSTFKNMSSSSKDNFLIWMVFFTLTWTSRTDWIEVAIEQPRLELDLNKKLPGFHY